MYIEKNNNNDKIKKKSAYIYKKNIYIIEIKHKYSS